MIIETNIYIDMYMKSAEDWEEFLNEKISRHV